MNYSYNNETFIIKNYNNVKTFASFFPGISGIWGKPLWTFYANRGQAISSFGTKDKNGAILEFVAANKAYRQLTTQGFRTFLKINGKFYEPFHPLSNNKKSDITQTMYITPYLLTLEEINKEIGINIKVEYFTLPNEKVAALLRVLTIKNISNKNLKIEIIDGLNIIIPYGTNNKLLKDMSRLAEGLFSGVIFHSPYKIPVYKLEIDSKDKPEIDFIEPANFYYGFFIKNKKKIIPDFIIDPDIIFGSRTDMILPEKFINSKFKINKKSNAATKTPSAMGYLKTNLKKEEKLIYNSVIGNSDKLSFLSPFITKFLSLSYISSKKEENRLLIKKITNDVLTKSNYPAFDEYIKQTYIDNILRGGYPVQIGNSSNSTTYYVFSRIHGDMEREYNDFVLTPEYFSQGNGNYRDVNQNRRNDIFFHPEIESDTLKYFINLIQLDGYNPFKVLGIKFKIKNKEKFYSIFPNSLQKYAYKEFNRMFTPGEVFKFLEKNNINFQNKKNEILNKIVESCEKIEVANAVEGYWSDHWHYNIDLLESFQKIYPDKFNKLMINTRCFTFYDNPLIVLPRDEKYVLYDNRPVQIDAVYNHPEKEKMIQKRKNYPNRVRTEYGKGKIYKTTLLSKLIILIINKYASLDPEGIGVEMEADKPNWYDALNGLPGLFGSSVSETIELKRLINLILNFINSEKNNNISLELPEEAFEFLLSLYKISKKRFSEYEFWNKRENLKEKYRKKIIFGVSGKEKRINLNKIEEILKLFKKILDKGIKKSLKNSNLINTYFFYRPVKYEIIQKNGRIKLSRNNYPCIKVKKFKRETLPYFLEGTVHYLRLISNPSIAQNIHKNILKSPLYDKKLKMLKINAPLKPKNYYLGRVVTFTPGWLENESIWLHMEYKYLLELIKNNLIEEYYKLIKTTLIPFLNPEKYGRSIFENVSFIVSSAYPDKEFHGRGFVARLSGSTAEFLSMWLYMTVGDKPFYLKNNNLILKFDPMLASDFFTKKRDKIEIIKNNKIKKILIPENSFFFNFLGDIGVIYINPSRKNTYGKNKAIIKKFILRYKNGDEKIILKNYLESPFSNDVRNKKVDFIEVYFS